MLTKSKKLIIIINAIILFFSIVKISYFIYLGNKPYDYIVLDEISPDKEYSVLVKNEYNDNLNTNFVIKISDSKNDVLEYYVNYCEKKCSVEWVSDGVNIFLDKKRKLQYSFKWEDIFNEQI